MLVPEVTTSEAAFTMLKLSELRFLWWNVCNFAHFEPTRASFDRWPNSQAMFEAKLQRIDCALTAMYGERMPELIGFCEITRKAAEALQSTRLRNYEVIFHNRTMTFRLSYLLKRKWD